MKRNASALRQGGPKDDVTAKIPGADAAEFLGAANNAKAGCPISRLLGAAARITMDARPA